MGLFKVGSKINDVEVYVHNRYEHFKTTANKMRVQGKIRSTVMKIKNNVRGKVTSIQGAVSLREKKYLSILGKKTKKEYYDEFSNYKNVSQDSILDIMYSFTDLGPQNYKNLEEIIYRKFDQNINLTSGRGVKKRREDALKMLYPEMQKTNKNLFKSAKKYLKNLITEYEINDKKGTNRSTLGALKKRQEALKQSAEKLKMTKTPKTVDQAQKTASKLRSTSKGFGVSFEPVAAGVVQSLNNFINGALKQGPIEVVADKDYENNYVTDVTFNVLDMNIGVDVKSNRVLYKKNTQREGFSYEILSSIFLGKGGFSELGSTSSDGTTIQKFGNILSQPDPEFLKQMTYLLVNSTIFKGEAADIKATNQAQQGLRSMLIIGGLIDFIVTYIARATKGGKEQILIFAGDEIIFTTDFIDQMIRMIGSIKPNNLKNIYGINYSILDEGETNKIGEGLKQKMLKEKLRHVREGIDTYPELFTKVGSEEMKKITSAALQRSMQIRLSIPLSDIFKRRNS